MQFALFFAEQHSVVITADRLTLTLEHIYAWALVNVIKKENSKNNKNRKGKKKEAVKKFSKVTRVD